ncbi:MAG: NAD-dependent epimerase/dehydratase family protein [Chloroflexi bacterium]|nr:NAD-dependent epimerase/dehydratase family protein [Chloroflexota bacterium]
MRLSKVMVTGGAGFIGSHLVDRLLRDGMEVVVVDNLTTGRRSNLNAGAAFHEVDISDPRLEELFRQDKPEAVFHLAAQISVSRSLNDPIYDATCNIIGAIHLLELCRRFEVERFVYSSTGGALYGEPERLPCSEEHPVRPLSPYGVSKYAGEHYLRCIGSMASMKYSILRYANVYGPRQDPEGEAGVIAIFAKRLLQNRQVVIYGSGQQERDFVYVDDVVDANLRVLQKEAQGPYNIGTGRSTSIEVIFHKLAQLTNCRLPPLYDPPRKGEVAKISLDIARATSELDWLPTTDLDEGLARTVEYFRSTSAQ